MKLLLTDDNGVVIDTWYISNDEEIYIIKENIESMIVGVFASKEECDELNAELNQWQDLPDGEKYWDYLYEDKDADI